ncbi:MAG: hypothetical protein ACLFR6_03195 [Salinarchaeum sp.]
MPEQTLDSAIDSSDTEQQHPVACPFCGHDAIFDKKGHWTRELDATTDSEELHAEVWHQFECPFCENRFAMKTADAEIAVE